MNHLDHNLHLTIPFPNDRYSEVAVKVLRPDPILRPEDFQVEYKSKGNLLEIDFKSVDDRVLRVGVSSVIDSVKTIVETIDELDYM
ncbi:hypothetical protein ZYGR_0H05360 [Zygosaccharomyces rouxii]|uniref:ZYRO0B16368p n=2 Tax=Zygosaccharomyces rouxii TaxID=4956 RepID=C5DSF2_ZYGRC|nr:uncharacterized protein ZYRO0B16368g [Zygosaccharomyces rouxii]GAV47690.1 hypothetical protein ZYGR_0H05360 [Zygosaccharomyces rouxii]CAR26713.1 ZYRO0B16368p [Zygosaccharomyces rouxii]